jgi:hypothetical protein
MLGADPEQSKEVTDVENGGSIKMRYKDVTIPPGVRRVFVHNIEHPFRNPSGAVYGRRLVTHVISGPIAAAQAAVFEAEKASASAAAAASLASYAVSHCLEQFGEEEHVPAPVPVTAPDNTTADEHGDGETQEQIDRRRVECDRLREETEKRGNYCVLPTPGYKCTVPATGLPDISQEEIDERRRLRIEKRERTQKNKKQKRERDETC